MPDLSGGDSRENLLRPGPSKVYERLRAHRVFAYSEECGRITERISRSGGPKGYVPYLSEKKVAAPDIEKVLTDVKEIRAAL